VPGLDNLLLAAQREPCLAARGRRSEASTPRALVEHVAMKREFLAQIAFAIPTRGERRQPREQFLE